MNQWVGIGRLCGEPEVRYAESGKAIATYRLAVNRDYKKDGQTSADFISCVAFGNNGEFAKNYLHKGMRIAVVGRIQTRDYTNSNGQKVYVTEVIVDRHEFCDSKKTEIDNNVDVFGGQHFSESSSDDDLPF